MELNIGDVVVLRSGSIPMTVIGTETGNKVTCQWYNEMEGTFPAMSFVTDALMVMDDDDDLFEEDEEVYEEEDEL